MKNTVGERVFMLRTFLNLTQEGFARQTQITSAQLSRIETGVTEAPRLSTLTKICQLTGADPNWLIKGIGKLEMPAHDLSEVSGDDVEDMLNKRDQLIIELRKQVKSLTEQVEYFKGLIEDFRTGKINFLPLLKTTGANGSKAKAFLRSQAA